MILLLSRLAAIGITAALCLFVGCRQEETSPSEKSETAEARAPVELTVVVVDDPPLAAGIELLGGEWQARSGGELNVTEQTLDELLAGEAVPGDLVVYPSRIVGELVDRNWVRPVRESVLRSDEVDFQSLPRALRDHSLRYARVVYGLSLGESPLLFAAAEAVDSSAEIRTWTEFDGQFSPGSNSPLTTPLAAELVARAVHFLPLDSGEAVLFDPGTMKPRLESAVFERAFSQLFEWRRQTGESLPPAVLTWPGAPAEDPAEISFLPLPVAEEQYRAALEEWESATDPAPVTILGFAGRSISVTASSRNAVSAFKLLEYLGSIQTAEQLSKRSDYTAPLRQFGAGLPGEEQLQQSLNSQYRTIYLLPRIPGIDAYLAALEAQIQQALTGDANIAETLSATSKQWEEITERLGRERQLVAYRKHLGLTGSGE